MMQFYWSRNDLIIVALKAVRSSREVARTIFQYKEIIVKIERLLHLMWTPYPVWASGSCYSLMGRESTMGCGSHLVI
jgi:hypothetical protein